MKSFADRPTNEVSANHDALSLAACGLSDEQLSFISGSSPWPVSRELSDLGSGAEMALRWR